MRLVRFTRMALLDMVLSLLLTQFVTTRASAGDEGVKYWVSRDPSIGYAVPIPHVDQFPASFVFQPTAPRGYAVPVQHVFQFPASYVYQPGPRVPFGGARSTYDRYGRATIIPR
jgi:hypothetical protein